MLSATLEGTRIALTWGDCGENHAGNQQVGQLQKTGTGLTMDDLYHIRSAYTGESDIHEFSTPSEMKRKAGVLVLRNFLDKSEQQALLTELTGVKWDTKFFNARTGKVLNKHARSNLLFQRGVSQIASYEEGKGTIVDINRMSHLSRADLKIQTISQMLNQFSTPTSSCELICEGNRYNTAAVRKSDQQGIGYHGDSERTRVFALSVGGYNYPIQWVLFNKFCPQAEPERVLLNSGDMYIMSELAVGQEWKRSSQWTWRHAAGHPKYLSLDRYIEAERKRVKKRLEKRRRSIDDIMTTAREDAEDEKPARKRKCI